MSSACVTRLVAQSTQHGHLVTLCLNRLQCGTLLLMLLGDRTVPGTVGPGRNALLRSQNVVSSGHDVLLHSRGHGAGRSVRDGGHAHRHGLDDERIDRADRAHRSARGLGKSFITTFTRAGAVETAGTAVGEVALPAGPSRDDTAGEGIGRSERELDRSVSSTHSVVLHGDGTGFAVVVRSVLRGAREGVSLWYYTENYTET
jgi:hypothetical protein